MSHERFAVLSDLIDGQPVDPAAVQQALNDPAGVDQLVEFTRLRSELLRDDAEPSNETEARIRRLVGTDAVRRQRARMFAVAAVLAVALFWAGGLLGRVRSKPDRERPPIPTRVVRFEPGVDWHPVSEVKP